MFQRGILRSLSRVDTRFNGDPHAAASKTVHSKSRPPLCPLTNNNGKSWFTGESLFSPKLCEYHRGCIKTQFIMCPSSWRSLLSSPQVLFITTTVVMLRTTPPPRACMSLGIKRYKNVGREPSEKGIFLTANQPGYRRVVEIMCTTSADDPLPLLWRIMIYQLSLADYPIPYNKSNLTDVNHVRPTLYNAKNGPFYIL